MDPIRRMQGSILFRKRQRADRRLERQGPVLRLSMDPRSRTLLIAFGGQASRMGIPPFEFLSLTQGIPVKKLLVRDLRQSWYHRGIEGHESFVALAGFLEGEIARFPEVERLVVTGHSSGAYAALAFGTLLGADAIVALSPQTILEPEKLASMGDYRWYNRLNALADVLDPEWTDLRRALPKVKRPRTSYRVYFDGSFEADRLHAENLADLDSLRLYRFGHGGHELVRSLRDTGALGKILGQAVDPAFEAGPLSPLAKSKAAC